MKLFSFMFLWLLCFSCTIKKGNKEAYCIQEISNALRLSNHSIEQRRLKDSLDDFCKIYANKEFE